MMNTRQAAPCLSTAITVPNTSNLMRAATSHGSLRQPGTVNTAYATTIAAKKATSATDKQIQITQKNVSLRLVAAETTARPYARGPSAKRRTGTPEKAHASDNATAATSNNDHITAGSSAINAMWPSRSGDDRMTANVTSRVVRLHVLSHRDQPMTLSTPSTRIAGIAAATSATRCTEMRARRRP